MKLFLRKSCALAWAAALGLLVGGAQAEDAQQAVFIGDQTGVETASFLSGSGLGDSGSVELVGYNSGMSNLNLGASSGCQRQTIAGVDYLQLRATHSQQLAYVERDVSDADPANWFVRYNQFDSSYTDSYRAWVGCRLPECGQEFRFTYSSFNGDGGFTSRPQVGPPGTGGTVNISSPFEVVPAADGDSLFGTSFVQLDNFDLACMKTIPLGCALGCCDPCGDCCDECCDDCCGDTCCDPCGGCGCFCPAWDITWSGGLRIADLASQLNYFNNVATPSASRSAISRVDFEGIGLRGGVLGRRYFGKSGMTSVFLKGDISLLVGEMDYLAQQTSGTSAFTTHYYSNTQVIPVTELEAGGTVALTKNLSVSGGYLLSAWHDLGHRAEYNFVATTTNQVLMFDDANILAFDGWFLRVEGAF